MKIFFSSLFALVEKDIRLEVRSKQAFFAALLFVLVTLFIFSFGFKINPGTIADLAPGIFWVTIAFAGSLLMSHLTHREKENRTNEGLLLSGCGGTILFFSKFITLFIFMMVLEIATIPLCILFFNFSLDEGALLFVGIFLLGTIGYAAVGTLFSTLLSHARLRDLLLPIVFYPVIIPLLIAAVQATQKVLEGETPRELMFMLGFDMILVTASVLLFDFVTEDPS